MKLHLLSPDGCDRAVPLPAGRQFIRDHPGEGRPGAEGHRAQGDQRVRLHRRPVQVLLLLQHVCGDTAGRLRPEAASAAPAPPEVSHHPLRAEGGQRTAAPHVAALLEGLAARYTKAQCIRGKLPSSIIGDNNIIEIRCEIASVYPTLMSWTDFVTSTSFNIAIQDSSGMGIIYSVMKQF